MYLQYIGLPHSEIYGYNGYLRLPVAYRSLSRPSSPLRAKAFPIRPSLLLFNEFCIHLDSIATVIGIFLCARLIVHVSIESIAL
jgi:hypothetical protein